MTLGYWFMGTKVQEKISSSYTDKITKTTESSKSYSFDVTSKISCGKKEGVSGVGLFQQVTEGTDGTMRVWGKQTVCRYGELWSTPPACPFEACLDAECKTCKDDWKA